MTSNADDPGRRGGTGGPAGGRGRGGRQVPPAPDDSGPPGTTTEPPWVLPSIVLGLTALTGSVLLIIVAAVAIFALWAFTVPTSDGRARGQVGFGRPPGGPPR